MKKLSTPFCRIGSKTPIQDTIIRMKPNDYKTYIEPFVGSGAIYFKLQNDPDKVKSVLNDKDKIVSMGFRLLKTNPTGDIEKFKNMSMPTLNAYVKSTQSGNLNNLAKAIIILCGTFGSKGYGPIYKTAGLYNKMKKIVRGDYKDYMKNTVVSSTDYKQVIRKYDNKDAFLFIDPPYEGSDKDKLYKDDSADILDELAKVLNTVKGKFLLTLNDSSRVRNLFSKFKIRGLSVRGGGGDAGSDIGRGTRKELIITNY